jgi:hypothetical protein
MGVTQQAYSKLERAKNISPLKIVQLLTVFNSNTDELEKIKNLSPPLPPHTHNFII